MASKNAKRIWSLLSHPRWVFWLIRGVIFLSFALWMLLSPETDRRMWLPLAFFLIYSLAALGFGFRMKSMGGRFYFITGIMDLISITLAEWISGGRGGGFFYLCFLVAPFGSYAVGLVPGSLLALFSSVFYLSVTIGSSVGPPGGLLSVQILALWALTVTVGIVVKEMGSSRSKLLRTFDILNQRTSELEKSQAQIETIYETSRTLVERLHLDEVVEEILNIVQSVMGYRFFSIFLLTEQRMLSLLGQIQDGKKVAETEAKPIRVGGVLETVVDKAAAVRVFDLAEVPDPGVTVQQMRSFMAVPLISRGKVIGLMSAGSDKIGAFLEQDERIFSILAGSAGLAIENARLHQKTQELTVVDDLTGLYNYRYFIRKLGTELMRASRYRQSLSLIMIDIDWFKRCNDTYGHLFGNLVLRDIARRTRESVREVDVVCRYGGEEFAAILPQTKKEDARMIGERIRQKVESAEFVSETKESRVRITVSLGVASFPENGETSKELIESVDQALYLAKGQGKNLVCTI
jgi:diguanylate cyclase (GGDEF)-like protein